MDFLTKEFTDKNLFEKVHQGTIAAADYVPPSVDDVKPPKITPEERAARCRDRIERCKQQISQIQDFIARDERFTDLPHAVRIALISAEDHLLERIAKNEDLADRFDKMAADPAE